jgi:hypothetical protein
MIYPKHWRYTPIKKNDKAPILDSWGQDPYEYDDVKTMMDEEGYGFGIILGEHSDGTVAIDFDGREAIDYFDDNIMLLPDVFMLNPIVWTSGKPDRFQIAFKVPKQYWPYLQKKVVGNLEFRWGNDKTSHQSVLPPSKHPETGQYRWEIEPNGTNDNLEIPDEILSHWLELCAEPEVEHTEWSGEKANDDDINNVLTEIKKHYTLSGFDEWRNVIWAVCHTVGPAQAESIMKHYYPEKDVGEYKKILKGYNESKSPTFGSLMKMVLDKDKTYHLPKPTVVEEVEEIEEQFDTIIPMNLLPEEMKNAMITMNHHFNTPFEMSLMSCLGILSLMSQDRYNVNTYEFGIIPMGDFFCGIASASGSKSTVFKGLARECFKAQLSKKDEYQMLWTQYKREAGRYEKQEKNYKNAKSDDEADKIQLWLDDPTNIPQQPDHWKKLWTKGTTNGLTGVLSGQPSVAIFTAEGGQFTTSWANTSASTSNDELPIALTGLWDEGHYDYVTGERSVILFNRRLSITMLIQHGKAADFFGKRSFDDQGFINRWILVAIPDWELPRWDINNDDTWELVHKELSDWHNKINDLSNHISTRLDGDRFALDLATLEMTDEAKAYYYDWYNNNICDKIKTEWRSIENYAKRITEHTARLAGAFAVFNGHSLIELDDITVAGALGLYFLAQFMLLDLTGDARSTHIVDTAKLVFKALCAKKKTEFSKTEIARIGPRVWQNMSVDEKEPIFKEMVMRGWLKEDKTGTRTKYDVNPKSKKKLFG